MKLWDFFGNVGPLAITMIGMMLLVRGDSTNDVTQTIVGATFVVGSELMSIQTILRRK